MNLGVRSHANDFLDSRQAPHSLPDSIVIHGFHAFEQRLILDLEKITPKEFEAQVQPWAQSVTKPVAVVTAASAAAAAADPRPW